MGTKKIKFIEKEDIRPICPYCEQPLDEIYKKKVSEPQGQEIVYFCPYCYKVLGASQCLSV